MTLPIPDAPSQRASRGVISGTGPEAAASGAVTSSPTTIIHATVELAPIMRLDLDDARLADAQRTAAPRPPRIAIMLQV